MHYISIDADDVGRRITSCYLGNDEVGLRELSLFLEKQTELISNYLISCGFRIIFCAGDGVVGSTVGEHDYAKIFEAVRRLSTGNVTYSAGVGSSLREAYVALVSAKSNGKNRLHHYSDLSN